MNKKGSCVERASTLTSEAYIQIPSHVWNAFSYLLYLVQITHLLRFTDVSLYPACVAVCEKHFHYAEKKTQCTNTNKVIKFSFRRYNTLMTYKCSFWLSSTKMNPHFWTANYTKATTEKELSLHFLCRSFFFCSNSTTIYLLKCMSL